MSEWTNPVSLVSQGGKLKGLIDLNGGMLAKLELMRGAKVLNLLHTAPWLKDNYFQDQANLIDHLAGEWACVPFGWIAEDNAYFKKEAAHGLPCHSRFEIVSYQADTIELVYYYPQDYVLEKLVRKVHLKDDQVDFSFTVYAKENVALPMGAHPCFPLDGTENKLDLAIKGDGIVYAIDCEKGISRFKKGAHFESLASIPLAEEWCKDGQTTVDARVLPYPYKTEEIVQMIHPEGEAVLTYKNKQVRLTLQWEHQYIQSCLLWMSNRGRDYAPWNGNNCCLGIEPIASAWDLTLDSVKDNAITAQGVKTTVELKKDQPFTFNYSIKVEDLA